MSHPDIAIMVVTGGPAVVKTAMSYPKKVIAAGPGNPPVVVDETAKLEERYSSDLSKGLGNLVARIIKLASVRTQVLEIKDKVLELEIKRTKEAYRKALE